MIPIATVPISFGEVLSLTRKLAFGNLFDESDVAQFEKELANYVGTKRVLACNSGRTALYLAMKALGLNPGDEVLVPGYTCAILFEVVLRAGLKPVFVDVNLETCNLNSELIPKILTLKTKAIIPVHLFGRPCDIDLIVEAADKYGLYIVEDVAQALGAEYKGQKAGSFGDLAIFSFGPGKSITGGQGGAIAVNNPDLIESIESFQSQLPNPNLRWKLLVTRNVLAMKIFSSRSLYGLVKGHVDSNMEKTDEMIIQNCSTLAKGLSSPLNPSLKPAKMPEASASVILKQLQKIDALNEKRIMNANELSALLRAEDEKSIQLPKTYNDSKSTFTRFPIRILRGNRTLVIKEMSRRGVDAKELYYYAADLLHKLSKAQFPNTEALSDSLIALPNHPLLAEEDLKEISTALLSTLQGFR